MNPKNRDKYGCQKVLKKKQNRFKTKRYIHSLLEVPFINSTQKFIQKGKDHLSYVTQSLIVKMNREYENQSGTINKNHTLRDPLGSCQKDYEGVTYEQSGQPNDVIFFEDTFYTQRRIIECQNKIDLQLQEIKKLEESSLRH